MNSPPTIQIRDLGRLAYGPALELQRSINQQVIEGLHPPTILLVEHDPVITLTRRPSVRDHLIADEVRLAKLGVEAHETDRGGDITYHGPGQLVVYPILKLGDFGLNLSSYMRLLEQAVIGTVAAWGIAAHRECGATGVWVDPDGIAPGATDKRRLVRADACGAADTDKPPLIGGTPAHATAKLCAMGVRIRKNTTLHGLALNVGPDMSHFDLIVPCGLAGRPVTSLRRLLGERCPTMDQVKQAIVAALTHLLAENVTVQARGMTTGS